MKRYKLKDEDIMVGSDPIQYHLLTVEEFEEKIRADERKRCISIVENFIDHILENNTGSLEELLNQLKEGKC